MSECILDEAHRTKAKAKSICLKFNGVFLALHLLSSTLNEERAKRKHPGFFDSLSYLENKMLSALGRCRFDRSRQEISLFLHHELHEFIIYL